MAEIAEAGNGNFQRKEFIAQLFGVDVRRVEQLIKEGVISTTKTAEGTRLDLFPTIQRYVQYLRDKARGKNRSENESKLREQKMKAEIELKESQGELHRLKTAIASGKYIAVEQVITDYRQFFTRFKRFALNIPSKLIDSILDCIDSDFEPAEISQLRSSLKREVESFLSAFVLSAVVELERTSSNASVTEKEPPPA